MELNNYHNGTDKLVRNGRYFENSSNYRGANNEVENTSTLSYGSNISSYITVILHHKRRGSGGLWEQVLPNENIRVSKKGKCIKMMLLSKIPFDHNNLAFRNVDVTKETTFDNGLTIERITTDRNQVGYTTDVRCKLSLVHRGLMQLQVAAPSFNGDYVYGYSVNFTTYSGGTFKTKIKSPVATENTVPPVVTNPSRIEAQVIPGSVEDPRNTQYYSESHQTQTPIRDSPVQTDNINVGHKSASTQTVNIVLNNLDVQGAMRAKEYYQLSDIRLKFQVQDIVDALTIVSKLEGKTYRWKKDHDASKSEEENVGQQVIGFIAQQVQQIIPESICKDDDGYLAVNYESIIPILVEAMKQHLKEYKMDNINLQAKLYDIKMRSNLESTRTGNICEALNQLQEVISSAKQTPSLPSENVASIPLIKRVLRSKRFHLFGGIASILLISVGLVLLILNNVANLSALEGNSAAANYKPQIKFVLEVIAAKPPDAGKPPKPDKTPNAESSPQTSPSPPIAYPASDYPVVNASFITLNVVGSLFLTLGVGLGVLVLLSVNNLIFRCFHVL